MEVHGLICLCMCIFSLPDISAMDEAEEPCPVDEDTKCINPSVTCEPIQDIKNKQSFVCTDNWNANSVCTLTCQEGNEVDGQKTITCRDDGTWDGGPPTCKVVTCDHIEGIKNNQSLECTDGWNAKSMCTLTCQEGFQNNMDGQKNITCRDNGTWDGGPLACNELQTPNTAWIILAIILAVIVIASGILILVVRVIYLQCRKWIGNKEHRGDPESHSSGDRSATGSVANAGEARLSNGDAGEMTRLLLRQGENSIVVPDKGSDSNDIPDAPFQDTSQQQPIPEKQKSISKEEDNKSVTTSNDALPAHPDEIVDNTNLSKLPSAMTGDWKSFASENFKIPEAKIEQIIGNYGKVYEQVYQVLIRWKKDQQTNATYRELNKALLEKCMMPYRMKD